MGMPSECERVLRVVARHYLLNHPDALLVFYGDWSPQNHDARRLLRAFEKEGEGKRTSHDVISAICVAAADLGFDVVPRGDRWYVGIGVAS